MAKSEEPEKPGLTFTWRIENFSYCIQKKDEFLESPTFVMDSSGNKTLWYIRLFPRGRGDNDDIEYNLVNAGGDVFGAYLDYELSFLDANGLPWVTLKETSVWLSQRFCFGRAKRVSHLEITGINRTLHVPQDTLTVRCCMSDSRTENVPIGHYFARTRNGVEKRSSVFPKDKFMPVSFFHSKKIQLEPISEEYPPVTFRFRLYGGGQYSLPRVEIDILQKNTNQLNLTTSKMYAMTSSGYVPYCARSDHWFEKKKGKQVRMFPLSIKINPWVLARPHSLQKDVVSLRCECEISIGVIYSKMEDEDLGLVSVPTVNSANTEMQSVECFSGIDSSNTSEKEFSNPTRRNWDSFDIPDVDENTASFNYRKF